MGLFVTAQRAMSKWQWYHQITAYGAGDTVKCNETKHVNNTEV